MAAAPEREYAERCEAAGNLGSERSDLRPVHETRATPEPTGVELVWGDGRRLRIGPGVDAATLRTVLAVLEPERC